MSKSYWQINKIIREREAIITPIHKWVKVFKDQPSKIFFGKLVGLLSPSPLAPPR